jgi:protein TonB
MNLTDNWFDLRSKGRMEIVFQNRNKEYGAYPIRKNYEKRVASSLSLVTFILFILIVMHWAAGVLKSADRLNSLHHDEILTLTEPPPIDKTAPPPPPIITPPPPILQTIKFSVPKVVKDETIESEALPTQEEVRNVQVSTSTQEGNTDLSLPLENPVVAEPLEEKIFTHVEEMPSYPGGNDALMNYLQKNIRYPVQARENNIEGTVYISFMIDNNGKIRDATLLRGLGGGCDEEALRVVKLMPDWKPGRQNGTNVKVKGIVVSVKFSLM